MEHTKEPWIADGTLVFMGNNEGGFDIRNCPEPEANARRIVACVNACQGIATDVLEAAKNGAALIDLVQSAAELKQQRDELKETLDVAIAAAQKAEKELIECMRQRDELLAAAVAIRADLVRRAEFDSEDGGAVLNISNGVLMQLDAAIAKVKP